MAHLGPPDMRGPIGYALNWPQRLALPLERLDFAALGALTFHAPDTTRFPALGLAGQVMERGGTIGAAFNGAKEAALDMFIGREIGFLDMARVVAHVLDQMNGAQDPDLAAIIAADEEARAKAREAAKGLKDHV